MRNEECIDISSKYAILMLVIRTVGNDAGYDTGKPVVRRGRKATDLFWETAGLPALLLFEQAAYARSAWQPPMRGFLI
jgi:hypothetical protein